MRLIDADDFLDLFYVASAGQDKAFINVVEMVVADTPTIDAEPVRSGQWIEDWPRWVCSYCKSFNVEHAEYVPNDCMDCVNSCNWQWRGVKE